jgi:hypothetical protein
MMPQFWPLEICREDKPRQDLETSLVLLPVWLTPPCILSIASVIVPFLHSSLSPSTQVPHYSYHSLPFLSTTPPFREGDLEKGSFLLKHLGSSELPW